MQSMDPALELKKALRSGITYNDREIVQKLDASPLVNLLLQPVPAQPITATQRTTGK
ncbi:MAG: hypothetical protein AAFW89_11200 [Bacteroidota bacterium]